MVREGTEGPNQRFRFRQVGPDLLLSAPTQEFANSIDGTATRKPPVVPG